MSLKITVDEDLPRQAVQLLREHGYDAASVIEQGTRNPMKDYNFYVYILTNWNHEVMYIGMTNNLERRLYEHKNKLVDGFTRKYNVNKLVYYEHGNDVHAAIAREKEIKKWRREKKNNLVVTIIPPGKT